MQDLEQEIREGVPLRLLLHEHLHAKRQAKPSGGSRGHARCSSGATELIMLYAPRQGSMCVRLQGTMCMGSTDRLVGLHIFKVWSVKSLSSRRLCEEEVGLADI